MDKPRIGAVGPIPHNEEADVNAIPSVVLVALGGALGAVLRFGVVSGAARVFGPTAWPMGTFAVNALGGVAMGVLAGLVAAMADGTALGAHPVLAQKLRVFVGVGILGGFTTFSAYSLEIAGLIERRETMTAFGYAAGSVMVAVLGVMVGLAIARRVFL